MKTLKPSQNMSGKKAKQENQSEKFEAKMKGAICLQTKNVQ